MMDQKGCGDIARQLCGFLCHCLVRMMDDPVTRAFLIFRLHTACTPKCVRVCVCDRLCNDRARSPFQDVFEGSGETGVADGSWQTLKFSICLLIPFFFLLLNIKRKAYFLPHFYLYFKKLGVWRAPWAESYKSKLSMLFCSIWITGTR